jgi:hypothetical protein
MKFSSYLIENLLGLYYKDRSVGAVQGGEKNSFLGKRTHCMRKDEELLNVSAGW